MIARAILAALGLALVALAPSPAHAQRYRFPLTCDGCAYASRYLDHDPGGGVEDWNCGSRTYEGHDGNDFALTGGFASMDRGRSVVAAADGRVVSVHDGEADRCTSGACGQSNYVYLRHADGRYTFYGHLRRGSVRVRRDQRVRCGDVIGQVGSSGNSTGPHVHFEVTRGDSSHTFDPFAGPCSRASSWWTNQRGYGRLPGTACDGADEPAAPPEREPVEETPDAAPPEDDASMPPPLPAEAPEAAPSDAGSEPWSPDAQAEAPEPEEPPALTSSGCAVAARGSGAPHALGLLLALSGLRLRRKRNTRGERRAGVRIL